MIRMDLYLDGRQGIVNMRPQQKSKETKPVYREKMNSVLDSS